MHYVSPTPPEGVTPADLMASSTKGPVREPANNERVLCINRGNRVLQETFDGRHFEIPPGHFYIEYEAAKHTQRRQIVPGTKNPEGGPTAYLSFIGIVGVDDPSRCEPFTPEELAAFGEKVEAIDRGALSNATDRATKVIPTNVARAHSPTLGVGGGRGAQRGIDVSAQATDAAAAAASDVLAPPAESDTRADAAEAAGATPRRRR